MDTTAIAGRPATGRPAARRARDRGAGTVEMAIIALPLLIFTFLVVQAALVFYARSIALGAATQGANAARVYGSPAGTGESNARDFLERIGVGLEDPVINVRTGAESVTVTVTGRATSILPLVSFDVEQSASGPVERFIP
ncbi:TadE family protein [Catellatospora bangladeshensis]|uniref:TadE-like domain-containing protein n=1 Tax=Catellatospora bangladeshensis TaxID=310355 RepID=A0A8J3JE51_9ACTN|nr:TadE family protein [Catellatospora bangladeshensis]GIF83267.1 hypothetical protein Cba03nite_46160 [Catellatospora bangladeshensis]